MKYTLFPIFNKLVNPTKLLGLCSINEEADFKFHNFGFGMDTPFYRYDKESIMDVLRYYDEHDVITYFKKGYYSLEDGLSYKWNDVNSILWLHNKELNLEYYDPKGYIYFPLSFYSRLLRSLVNKPYYEKLFDLEISDNINTVIKASSNLDGFIHLQNKRVYKYFDHYTKGGRFRDVISNTISIEADKRKYIQTKGIKVYVDIDSYHLRLIDEVVGNFMPKNERGHDWLMRQVFKEGQLPDKKDQKKLVFTALYGDNFEMLPCEFTETIQRKKYLFKSPLGRKKIPFNYIIQEMDVLRMSKFINQLQSSSSDIVLYLYDGLLFDVKESYFEEFMNKCKKVIDLPFTFTVNEETLRFF